MKNVPRSLLFTPGSRPDRFLKAASSNADALILDLEDAVAADGKVDARRNVVQFLDSRPDIRQKVVVRINPLDWVVGLEDLAALASLSSGPDFVLVPKSQSAAELAAIGRVLDNANSNARLAGLVESAQGIARASELGAASHRLDFLMFGAADYAADLGQQVGVFRPDFARATLVNAAAASGIVAIDSPFFAIDRPDELKAACLAGSASGFHGMAAIHPSQIDSINDAYRPSQSQVELASRILAAAPDGVGVLDGKMIDIAMVRWAKRIA